MSEYQYYQFQSIDRPLTDRQIKELRGIPTRADITPTSFVNEYQWGDLKASPLDLMEKYFDAHLYVANQNNYDRAVTLLHDLRDLATTVSSDLGSWEHRVSELRSRHWRKPSLMKRFDKAGFR